MEVQVFNHDQFGQIRTIVKDGEPWFVGKDVATALGYSKSRNAISIHVDEDDKTTALIQGPGSNYKTQAIIINESGLYSLILSSKLEKAKQFKHWVTSEVLPSIRKHGAFINNETLEQMLGDPDYAIRLFTTIKKEREEKLELMREKVELENRITEQEPYVSYCQMILQTPSTVTVTQIAQDYGMSARRMNELLRDMNIQYRQNEQWILYSKFKKEGYVQSNTTTYTRANGTTGSKMYTRWTQQGRLFLYEKLRKQDILPVCEQEK